MQHKLKNVLAGLALAFMALTGIVLGEPVMPLLPGMATPATQLEAATSSSSAPQGCNWWPTTARC